MNAQMTVNFSTLVRTFTKSQVSGFVATLVDYSTLFALTEIFHTWYVFSTALGAFFGAIANFLLNRNWTFEVTHGHWGHQAKRYALVSGGSLLLNSGGVLFVTEVLHTHYAVSVAIVGILVAILYNYPLQRFYVYSSK
jgi:putative flippase GtrA